MRNRSLLSLLCVLLSSFALACSEVGDEGSAVLDVPVDVAHPLASVEVAVPEPIVQRPDVLAAPLADPVHYTCGWALSGYGCNNGRGHGEVYALDMSSAIAACRANQPPSLPDFCYVLDAQGGTSTDERLCGAAGGSWRPANSCCNFNGTLSCPNAPASYRCGYALPGYGCDNGRGSIVLTANSLASAITACRARQPANLPDFCYVRNLDAGNASDPSQCALGGGSWRVASNCCNYRGSTSCP